MIVRIGVILGNVALIRNAVISDGLIPKQAQDGAALTTMVGTRNAATASRGTRKRVATGDTAVVKMISSKPSATMT
jgi:hypothetical protein